MARSQNAMFRGREPAPDGDRIGGASLVRLLASELTRDGWEVRDFDCWRDGGWILPCFRGAKTLDLVLVPLVGGDAWAIQIAASRFPCFVLRWFGATPSADADDIFQLASATHAALTSAGMTDIRWVWDGPADAEDAGSEPQPAASGQDDSHTGEVP